MGQTKMPRTIQARIMATATTINPNAIHSGAGKKPGTRRKANIYFSMIIRLFTIRDIHWRVNNIDPNGLGLSKPVQDEAKAGATHRIVCGLAMQDLDYTLLRSYIEIFMPPFIAIRLRATKTRTATE